MLFGENFNVNVPPGAMAFPGGFPNGAAFNPGVGPAPIAGPQLHMNTPTFPAEPAGPAERNEGSLRDRFEDAVEQRIPGAARWL